MVVNYRGYKIKAGEWCESMYNRRFIISSTHGNACPPVTTFNPGDGIVVFNLKVSYKIITHRMKCVRLQSRSSIKDSVTVGDVTE